MDAKQIEESFYEAISERGISEKLEGISKDVIYHWRKKSRSVSIGDMLNVLYQLDLIEINSLQVKKKPGDIRRFYFEKMASMYWSPTQEAIILPYKFDIVKEDENKEKLFDKIELTDESNRLPLAEELIRIFFKEIEAFYLLNSVVVWIAETQYLVTLKYYLNISTPAGHFEKSSRDGDVYKSTEEIIKELEELKSYCLIF